MRNNGNADGDVLFVALCKTDDGRRDRYLIRYDPGREAEALRTIGKWAGDPKLSFNWRDAATLSAVVRKQKFGQAEDKS